MEKNLFSRLILFRNNIYNVNWTSAQSFSCKFITSPPSSATPCPFVDFVVLPPGHGRNVTDFWGLDAHEAQLRCPDDVWVVIEEDVVPGGVLNLNSTNPPRPHVLCGLRGPPYWAWQECNRLLRSARPWGAVTLSRWCVSGDRGGCSARRGLKPKFY